MSNNRHEEIKAAMAFLDIFKEKLRNTKLNNAFDYYLMSRYLMCAWIPEHYADSKELYTYMILVEEISEIELAYASLKDYDKIEELSDYYSVLKAILLSNKMKMEPQTPVNFRVSDLLVTKAVTKSARFEITNEYARIMQHYYLQYFNTLYYAYPGIKPHNIHLFLMGINIIKGVIRFWRRFNLYTERDLGAYLIDIINALLAEVRKYLSNRAFEDFRSLILTTKSKIQLK